MTDTTQPRLLADLVGVRLAHQIAELLPVVRSQLLEHWKPTEQILAKLENAIAAADRRTTRSTVEELRTTAATPMARTRAAVLRPVTAEAAERIDRILQNGGTPAADPAQAQNPEPPTSTPAGGPVPAPPASP